jgi:hypothetical protein
MTMTNDATTRKKAIAIKLRKLSDDIDEISEQINSLKEDKERWSVFSIESIELIGSMKNIINEWANEIEETIK